MQRAIVDGDLVATLEQAARHRGSHVPEADESNFHDPVLHNQSLLLPSHSKMLRVPHCPALRDCSSTA